MKTFLISFIAFLVFTSSVIAQDTTEASLIAPLPPDQGVSILGQDHYYSVTLRGNGEAVVTMKGILTNLQESTMSAVTLRTASAVPQDIVAYQVIREPQCIRYKEKPLPTLQKEETEELIYQTPECVQYQEPNYYDYWYGNNSYKKAKTIVGTDTITIEFPQAVKPNTSASFVLYYRSVAYIKKDSFGAYNFEFETLKVEDRIRQVQVGINTDSDLVLKGVKSDVNYQLNVAEGTAALKAADAAAAPIRSAQFDNFYQQIGYGMLTKTSQNLQPLDSFTVKGSYADAAYKLYGKAIVIGVIVFVIIVIALILLVKFLLHKFNKPNSPKKTAEKQSSLDAKNIVIVGGISFVSALLVVGYSLFIIFMTSMLVRYYYSYEFQTIIMIFFFIISALIYILFTLVPAVLVGVKKGVWLGVTTFGATIIWLLFFFFIILGIVFMSRMGGGQSYPYDQPVMMERGVGTDVQY